MITFLIISFCYIAIVIYSSIATVYRIKPKCKFLRRLYYWNIQRQREDFQEERKRKLGILTCEVCGRTSEQIHICPSCNRCSDPNCNAGCIFCR